MKSLNTELRQFIGTDGYYKFSALFAQFLLTDGTQYAAEKYGLYWFMDIVCSYQHQYKMIREEFQVWTLQRVTGDSFKVTCEDGNKNILQTQDIPFSDFKMDHFQVFLSNNIIFLPSEN